MADLPILHTPRLRLRLLDGDAAAAVLDYYRRNRLFHQPWFPERPDTVFTLRQQRLNLETELAEFKNGRAVPFWLSPAAEPERIIGRLAFTHLVHGSFHSAWLAYHLDRECQGQGLALEAGRAAIPVLFNDYGLHRIEANILPRNQRSIALAVRLGFELEGFSKRYLQINGIWEDHLHYVLLADGPAGRTAESASAPGQTGDPEEPLTTGQLILRRLTAADIPAALAFIGRNQADLGAWNPMPSALERESGWLDWIARSVRDEAANRGLKMGLFLPDRPDYLAGFVECTHIRDLPFSSGDIGYAIDRLLSGRGLMLDALAVFARHLFGRYGLNRLNAQVCAGNERSLRLLAILGFREEGVERQAVYLHGQWQDRHLLALLRSDFVNMR